MEHPFLDEAERDYAGKPWPCAPGLLAGTLALMTVWADPEPDARIDATGQRALLARKIVSNLFFLREHPDVPSGLRLVATRLHARWSDVAQRGLPRSPALMATADASAASAVH